MALSVEAFELARQRIAKVKESGTQALCLSPRDAIFDGKTYPGDGRLEYLSVLPPEIAGLSDLQSLSL